MLRRAGVLVVLAGSMMLVGCAGKSASFGEPMKLSSWQTVPIEHVFADMDRYEGKTVRVAGTVAKVCEKKGCWLQMTDDDASQTMFVKFTCPVEGRLIPMDAIGHPVIVEGVVTTEEMSQEEARHMAEDSGKSEAEIAKIDGPRKRVRMMSPGAEVSGI